MLQPALEQLGLGRRVDLRNDTQVALRAGTHQSWGVVVICGTGFNAAGRAPDGRELRWPGLGTISGDIAGGHAIALTVIRVVMRAADGRGEPTMLTELVLGALEQPSTYELMRALYHQQIERHRMNQVVPLVFKAALQGDHVAQQILISEGEEIGASAAAIITNLGLQEMPVEVVLGGSVYKGEGPLFLDTIRQRVHRTAPHAVLVRPTFEPVVGAVLLGLEAAGITATDALYASLGTTMPALGHA
jgi:N-acetylglucosamine kinase-like BadF-type ATPase